MARGRHYAPRRRIIGIQSGNWMRRGKLVVKWLGITTGGVIGGLAVAAGAMMASLLLIWAVAALLSYFL